jgi:hypothetical protein
MLACLSNFSAFSISSTPQHLGTGILYRQVEGVGPRKFLLTSRPSDTRKVVAGPQSFGIFACMHVTSGDDSSLPIIRPSN